MASSLKDEFAKAVNGCRCLNSDLLRAFHNMLAEIAFATIVPDSAVYPLEALTGRSLVKIQFVIKKYFLVYC